MKFGENLKNLRKGKNYSQDDLAEKMNVSRQSVSKWENGEAYPEMNNLLELCKIFKCKINDLVNDSILDIDALDDEVKNTVVKLKKDEQKKMKGLSDTIRILAKVAKTIILVCIPIFIISMIVLGFLISKVEVSSNEIRLNDTNDFLEISSKDDDIEIKFNGSLVAKERDQKNILMIKDMFLNHSKTAIFIYVEAGAIAVVIVMYLAYKMLKHLESLFKNIHEGDTPFTLENVNHIKYMAYLMIAMIILPDIGAIIFGAILKMDLDVGFELFNLIEILFLFSLAYIFQYGYEIQLDSKGKMYGEENE